MKSERVPIGLLVLSVAIGFNFGTYKTIAQDAAPSKEQIAALLVKAKAGDSDAQRRVGIAYEDESAYSQAAVWFRKAAEGSDAEAQYRLGDLYSEGHGVPQDDTLADLWNRKAAEQGYTEAQKWLGFMYFEGLNVPLDYRQAAAWWHKAAEKGDAGAECSLGTLYSKGQGVQQDSGQAAFWWGKSAEQGYAEAQLFLGSAYEDGQGVPQDNERAAFWYSKAAGQDVRAQNALVQLKTKLAAVEAEHKKRRDRIVASTLCVVLFYAVTYIVIRFRRMLVSYGNRFLPQTARAWQLAVLLLTGGWCSACCLIQVLNRRAMLHPVNAAVTALLWAIPGLILGAVSMWWLSHSDFNSPPVHPSMEPEQEVPRVKGVQGNTESVPLAQVSGFRWGKFQGWVILVFGVLDLLFGHPILLGNMYGRLGGFLLVITGIGLINRAKEGLVLFFICNGAILAGFLWTFRFSILSFDIGSMSEAPIALLCLLLAWWLTPAIFYYPKRWKEFSRRPSKAAPREAPPAIEADPQKARAEVGFFQTPK